MRLTLYNYSRPISKFQLHMMIYIITCYNIIIKVHSKSLCSKWQKCAFLTRFSTFYNNYFLFERLTKALCFTIAQMKMLVKQIAKKRRRKLWIFEPGKFTIQNVHRWNPHNLKRSKIYSLMEKYPILYEIGRGKVVSRNLAFRGCLDKLGGKILVTE